MSLSYQSVFWQRFSFGCAHAATFNHTRIYPGLQFRQDRPRNEVAVKLYEKKGFRRTSTGGCMFFLYLEIGKDEVEYKKNSKIEINLEVNPLPRWPVFFFEFGGPGSNIPSWSNLRCVNLQRQRGIFFPKAPASRGACTHHMLAPSTSES